MGAGFAKEEKLLEIVKEPIARGAQPEAVTSFPFPPVFRAGRHCSPQKGSCCLVPISPAARPRQQLQGLEIIGLSEDSMNELNSYR